MKKSVFVLMFTLFTLSLVGGFNSVTTTAQDKKLEKAEALEFKTLAKNINSGVHEAKNVVIRTREEWVKLWEAIHLNTAEKPELPEVDFESRMVIALFAGDKPTPGHDIAVLETLKVGKKKIQVAYKESKPGANCLYPQVLTQPYQIIEIDLIKKVSFNLLQEVKDCPNK
jgi:hypothetical protein